MKNIIEMRMSLMKKQIIRRNKKIYIDINIDK